MNITLSIRTYLVLIFVFMLPILVIAQDEELATSIIIQPINENTFQFIGQVTGTPTGVIWYIRDSQDAIVVTRQTNSFEFSFAASGQYKVYFSAWKEISGDQTKIAETVDALSVLLPASFEYSQLTTTTPLQVQFYNTSDGTLDSVQWTFHDGTTSVEASPIFIYTGPGDYPATLKVITGGQERIRESTVHVISTESLPNANFEMSTASGLAPLTVQFVPKLLAADLTYDWDFESDGVIDSHEQQPSHTFTTAKTYRPGLTVSNALGEDIQSADLFVYPPAPTKPNASFNMTPDQGTIPFTIHFESTSTGDIHTWTWVLPDGTTRTDRAFDFSVGTPGSYPVTLIVEGVGGISSVSRTLIAQAAVNPLQADFSSLASTANPRQIAFTNLSTGPITGYQWDFNNDGTIDSTEKHPIFTYKDAGFYTVKLLVIGDANQTATSVQPLSVMSYRLPDADFAISKPTAEVGESVTFTNMSLPGTAPIVSCYWQFGADAANSHDCNTTFTYTLDGIYTVMLTVTDENDVSSTENKTVTVQSKKILPSFTYGPQPIFLNHPITFTDTTTNNALSKVPVAWIWDFGDGQIDTSQTPTHTFTSLGEHKVILTVKASDGETASVSKKIKIVAEGGVQARIGLSHDQILPGQLVKFTDRSIPPENILSREWTIWDGSRTLTYVNTLPPEMAFPLPGAYLVSLTVTGAEDVTDTASATIHVMTTLDVTIDRATLSGHKEQSFSFSGTANNQVDTWAWNFGDGSPVRYGQSVDYVYLQPGDYTVTLTGTGIGGTDTDARIVHVGESNSLQAAFTASVYGGSTPLGVHFVAVNNPGITQYKWLVENQVFEGRELDHTFNTPGIYPVVLEVSNGTGTGKATTNITVFNFEQQLLDVNYRSDSTGRVCFFSNGDGEAEFTWLLGNGTSSTGPNPCQHYASGTYTVIVTMKPSVGHVAYGVLTFTVTVVDNEPPVTDETEDLASNTTSSDDTVVVFSPIIDNNTTVNAAPNSPGAVVTLPSLPSSTNLSGVSTTILPESVSVTAPTSIVVIGTPVATSGQQQWHTLASVESALPTSTSTWITPPNQPLNSCGMTLFGQDSPYSCMAATLCTVLSAHDTVASNCVSMMREELEKWDVLSDEGGTLEQATILLQQSFELTDTKIVYSRTLNEIKTSLSEGFQIIVPLQVVNGDVRHAVVVTSITESIVTYGDPLTGMTMVMPVTGFERIWDGTAVVVPASVWCNRADSTGANDTTSEPLPEKPVLDVTAALAGIGAVTLAMLAIAGTQGRITQVAGQIGGRDDSQGLLATVSVDPSPAPFSTLSGIAYHYYGDYSKYTILASYNNILNPDLIFPNQIIRIPQLDANGQPVGPNNGGGNSGGGSTPQPYIGPIVGPNTPVYNPVPFLPGISACPDVIVAIQVANAAIQRANDAEKEAIHAQAAASNQWGYVNYIEQQRNEYASRAAQCASQIPQAALRAAQLSVEEGVEWGKLKAAEFGVTVNQALESAAWGIWQAAKDLPWWFPGRDWIISEAERVYNNFKQATENSRTHLNNQRQTYQNKQQEATQARQRVDQLGQCAIDNGASAAYLSAVALGSRVKAHDLDWQARQASDKAQKAKLEKDYAIANFYGLQKECIDAQINSQKELLAGKLAGLSGVSAATWLALGDQRLGYRDVLTDLQTLINGFEKLKDQGISLDLRQQIAGKIVNENWNQTLYDVPRLFADLYDWSGKPLSYFMDWSQSSIVQFYNQLEDDVIVQAGVPYFSVFYDFYTDPSNYTGQMYAAAYDLYQGVGNLNDAARWLLISLQTHMMGMKNLQPGQYYDLKTYYSSQNLTSESNRFMREVYNNGAWETWVDYPFYFGGGYLYETVDLKGGLEGPAGGDVTLQLKFTPEYNNQHEIIGGKIQTINHIKRLNWRITVSVDLKIVGDGFHNEVSLYIDGRKQIGVVMELEPIEVYVPPAPVPDNYA